MEHYIAIKGNKLLTSTVTKMLSKRRCKNHIHYMITFITSAKLIYSDVGQKNGLPLGKAYCFIKSKRESSGVL